MNLPKDFVEYAKEWEAKIHAFTELNFEGSPGGAAAGAPAAPAEAAALVKGLPFAAEDSVAVKGLLFTCGSKMLENFRLPYSATAVQKLEEAGGFAIGKTNMDEFGAGLSTDSSAIKKTSNPWDLSRVPGGSGGAAAVAAGIVPYALGMDTGGCARQSAAFCGLAALKPTYGAVSRYGLNAYASSFDTLSITADTTERCRAVFALVRGRDAKDQNSKDAPAEAAATVGALYPAQSGGKKIGVFSAKAMAAALAAAQGAVLSGLSEEALSRSFDLVKQRLADLGHSLVDVEIPDIALAGPAYFTIATAEASANLARFNGIRFGHRPADAENPEELVSGSRREGFGLEIKKRIALGTYLLSSGIQERYYLHAQRVRTGLKKTLEELLSAQCDALLMPVYPFRAFARGQVSLSMLEQRLAEVYTCPANLTGLPALAFPASLEDGLPAGVQLVGRSFSEGTLLDIAQGYEQKHPLSQPAGFKAFWR
ncbi:MAG: amidase family protein [Spirochaetes bacterium]|nr:amidase family protein [Spirochaetota bacterium]